jgi:hypothetical protein
LRRFLHDFALSLSLFLLFALSLVGQWLTHSGSFSDFLNAVFENHQSEFLQLFAFVVLAAYLIHRGSPQSKDGDDEMRRKLDRIERKLDRLEGSERPPLERVA